MTDRQTDGRTDRQTDRQTHGEKQYVSRPFGRRHKYQMCSNCTADKRHCFRYTDSTFFRSFKVLACFYRSGSESQIVGLLMRKLTCNFCHCNIFKGKLHVSLRMRKPTICIGENKDADQLRDNREADQRLCFRHMDSTIPLLLISKVSSF